MTLIAAAFMTAAVSTQGFAPGADIRATIEPAATAGHVIVTLRNTGDRPQAGPRALMLGPTLAAPMFNVTDASGQSIDYAGPWVNWNDAPMPTLAPGETWRTELALTSAYPVPAPGVYRVTLPGTQPVDVWFDMKDGCDEGCGGEPSSVETFEPFKGCTFSMRSHWSNEIVPWARLLATLSFSHLQNDTTSPPKDRNELWFGASSSVVKAAATMAEVVNRLATPEVVEYSCDQCPYELQSWANAFVLKGVSNRIYTCPWFWKHDTDASTPQFAYQTGQAAILIHEMTHFANIASTEDYDGVHEYNTVVDLAKSSPTQAYKSAENFEHHAQNNPCVGCKP